jgi:hypothetical protein
VIQLAYLRQFHMIPPELARRPVVPLVPVKIYVPLPHHVGGVVAQKARYPSACSFVGPTGQ